MSTVHLKRTKIIATLGPACRDESIICRMIEAGADAFRLNFSHGNVDEHRQHAKRVRQCAHKLNKPIALLADLQGPKIRIARFSNKTVTLEKNQTFVLNASLDPNAGDENQVGIDYHQLPNDVSVNDTLLLDDGRLVLQVTQVTPPRIICKVLTGGVLSNNKGINRQGGGLSAHFMTTKDHADLKAALTMGVDYIAFSFPRSADDIHTARALIQEAKGSAGIIAKIERAEALADLDNIILASDAIMIARGDLGVEIGDAELPLTQKNIIHRCRALDRAVITATQMMESMIENSIPTRAEVFDIANAILDGTDAMMLSAETATGKHPEQVIEAAARICLGAEKNPKTTTSRHRLESRFKRVDEAIAMAVMYTANHMNLKAIISLTETGSTPLWMSRIRSGIPIYGLSRNEATQRRMALYRGVYPIHFDITQVDPSDVNQQAIQCLVDQNILQQGDLVILTKGDCLGILGGTNAMKIIQVGNNYYDREHLCD